jgi:hypothetical protein
MMKTSDTFHRHYHYSTYYRQSATGYYNRLTYNYANRYESLRKEFANNDFARPMIQFHIVVSGIVT